jgi:hypothetical protein
MEGALVKHLVIAAQGGVATLDSLALTKRIEVQHQLVS